MARKFEAQDWIQKIFVAAVLGFGGLILFAMQFTRAKGLSVAAVGFAVAGASGLVGVLIGFLFGLPRAREPEVEAAMAREAGDRYRPNTNLEQISDWLTKILVGVGLVQLGTIGGGLARLGRSLSPALGNIDGSGALALSIIAYFSIDGFLMGYLWSRLFFLGALQAQDVQLLLDERQAGDVNALRLLDLQLNPDPGIQPVTQQALEDAVRAATPATQMLIFEKARGVRKDNWQNNPELMARTIPIFRALVATESQGRSHRSHGQLGFALKDKQPPDWQEADAALTKAIELRGDWRTRGYWLYEYNRGVSRIELDGRSRQTQPSDPAMRKRIVEDLAVGGQYDPSLLEEEPVSTWILINKVGEDELAPP